MRIVTRLQFGRPENMIYIEFCRVLRPVLGPAEPLVGGGVKRPRPETDHFNHLLSRLNYLDLYVRSTTSFVAFCLITHR